jgi:hypothetical protein
MIMAINPTVRFMKNNAIQKVLFAGLFSCACIACDDLADPLKENLNLQRAYTPTALTAMVRNLTSIELNWKVRPEVDHYVVEFSQDSLVFGSIIRTVTVKPDELPLLEVFGSETRYSARVKAVSAIGAGDSKWASVTIATAMENIFLPIENGAIDKTTVTLKWPEGSEVTHLLIKPGDVRRDILEAEAAAGSVTVTGLSEATSYTVTLYNATKQRGQVTFETLVDGTPLHPEDDLVAAVAAAAPGEVLVLYPGEYDVTGGVLNIDKPISIRGLYPYDKPVVRGRFTLQPGSGNVLVTNLELDGELAGVKQDFAFAYNSASGSYGTLTVKGCVIHDYVKSLVSNSTTGIAAEVAGISFDDCVVTDVTQSGGDFIDFRAGYVASVRLINSTFNRCAAARDFIRLDAAAGLSGTGKTSVVLIDHCTIYASANNPTDATKPRLVYVRFAANTLDIRHTLIAATNGLYTNQSASSQPACGNNNYFTAVGFHTDAYVTGAKIDVSGDYTTLDPGFANAAEGDFKLTNQDLIDRAVGDPRWRQ